MRYSAPIVLSLFFAVTAAQAYMPRPCHDPPPYAQTNPLLGGGVTTNTSDDVGEGVELTYECSMSQENEAWTAGVTGSIQDGDSDGPVSGASMLASSILAAAGGPEGMPLRLAGQPSRIDDDLIHFTLNFRYFPKPFRDRHCPSNADSQPEAAGVESESRSGGERPCVPYDASTQLYVSTGVLYTVEPFQDLGLSAGVGLRVDLAQFESLKSLSQVLLDVEASYRVHDVGDFEVDSVVVSFGFKYKIGKRDRKSNPDKEEKSQPEIGRDGSTIDETRPAGRVSAAGGN